MSKERAVSETSRTGLAVKRKFAAKAARVAAGRTALQKYYDPHFWNTRERF